MNTSTQARTEYRILNRAVNTLRESFMAGDLSGFESHQNMHRALRGMEARMFEITQMFC